MLSWSDLISDCGKEQIDEFMRRLIITRDSDHTIKLLIDFLSENYGGISAFIYESEDKIYKRTYYTSANQSNLVPEFPEIIEKVAVGYLVENIEEDEAVIISNIGDKSHKKPSVFEIFATSDIKALILMPMYEDYHRKGEIVGFIGAIYSMGEKLSSASKVMRALGHIVPALMEKRDLKNRLYHLSYHDQLTNVLNRYAYTEFKDSVDSYKSLGVIYCDISDLKSINDREGHQIGDALLVSWSNQFKDMFEGTYKIFRIGGDEFFIVFTDCTREEFESQEMKLRKAVQASDSHLSVGSKWTIEPDKDLDELIKIAENAMYLDKSKYYDSMRMKNSKAVERRNRNILECVCEEGSFSDFILNNYFDVAAFFESVSLPNDYPYVGDMESNLFYVSDGLRDLIGCNSNIVPNLLEKWAQKIIVPQDKELYLKDIKELFSQRKDTHDLKYRVRDRNGNDIWVHCHGNMKWNKDRTKPLFFAGKLSRQEEKPVIDPATNFQKEYAAIMKLESMKNDCEKIHIIGFTFNKFKDINDVHGRAATDVFLKEMTNSLSKEFQKSLEFFRLDGMQFVAIVDSNNLVPVEDLISQLRGQITAMYYKQGVLVKIPCSMGLISEKSDNLIPREALYNMSTLLIESKRTLEEKYLVYSEDYISKQRMKTSMSMALNHAVMNGFKDFRIVVQPIVETKNLKIVAGETLLRWKFRGKDVSPAEIVPILEENNLIVNVGEWVFEQAVKECTKVIRYLPNFRLSVNVSYFQILDTGFIIFMERILKKYGVDGSHILVEITETHYDEAPAKVTTFIEECKKLGLTTGIDDFGDGYSSLAFLLKYAAGLVKLDRSLIREMLHSESNEAFISTVVYACHKLGKLVCAEGVENKDEMEAVINMGCDSIQGYYFHKPMELNKLHELISGIK